MRHSRFCCGVGQQGAGSAQAGLLALALLAWTGWTAAPWGTATGVEVPSGAAGVVSGLFVGGAVLAALVGRRRHVTSSAGWGGVAGALVAAQAVLTTLPVIAHPPRSAVDLALVSVAAVVGTSFVALALIDLWRTPYVADDSVGVGLGMGFLASGHLLLMVPSTTTDEGVMRALMVLLAGTQLVTAVVVVGAGLLPRRLAWLVAATGLTVAAGLGLTVAGLEDPAWSVGVSMSLAVVGAAWIAIAWECVHDALRRDSESARLDQVALSSTRDHRERLHELRSTVAGLVNGSAILDHADIDDASRVRIWESLRRELDRMQRLLSDEHEKATQIDLDEALTSMLDLQELKGRQVELRSDGELVRARHDALAEVVNILVDNAALHGGSDSSLVEVARRDDETVDITVTDYGRGIAEEDRDAIFEWGRRGSDSPGEGIGLHVAQRLVAEDGGSLSLRETEGAGSSFVISLPAPRRSPENDLSPDDIRGEDDHAAWRRSG